MATKCANCGALNPEDAIRCARCGATVLVKKTTSRFNRIVIIVLAIAILFMITWTVLTSV